MDRLVHHKPDMTVNAGAGVPTAGQAGRDPPAPQAHFGPRSALMASSRKKSWCTRKGALPAAVR